MMPPNVDPTQQQPPAPQGGGLSLPPPQGGQQPQGMPMGQGPALPAPQQQEVTIDDVVEFYRSTALRRFRIDIETDSTVTGDESQERQDRQGLIESLTKMVEAWGPIVQQQPVMANLASELMMFGIRGFRVGRTLEETVQETVDKLSAELGQPKPPPQPSPDELIKMQGIQAKTQAEIQKATISAQQAQTDAQMKGQQAQVEAQMEDRKHQLETAKMQIGIEHDRERHTMDMARADHSHRLSMEQKQVDAEHKRQMMKEHKPPRGED